MNHINKVNAFFLLFFILLKIITTSGFSGCLNNELCLSALIDGVNIKKKNETALNVNVSLSVKVNVLKESVGRTFYIGTNGNDKNSGTDTSTPWNTFSGGIKNVVGGLKGGDTVCYLTGTYRNPYYGDGNIWKQSPSDTIINLSGISGSANSYITIRPCDNHKVKFEFDSAIAIRITLSSYIRIIGFEIEGYTQKLSLSDALKYQYAYRYTGSQQIYYRDPDQTLPNLLQEVEKPASFNQNAITIGNSCHHIDLFDLFIHDSTGHGIASLGGVDYVNIIHNEFVNTTWWSSNGNHAISFKNLKSIDTNDDYKIIVRGNLLKDCSNRIISWSLLKVNPVEKVIDEGKGIHCQDSTSDSGWKNGKVLFGDNVIIRQGNAGVTINNAERVVLANNTLIDNGYLNVLMAQSQQTDPNVDVGFSIGSGGIRANGGKNCEILNNLVIQRQNQNAFDTATSATSLQYLLSGNVYNGGKNTNAPAFQNNIYLKEVSLPIFQNPSIGDFSILNSSLNAGSRMTVQLCVNLSWENAKVRFEGLDSNCADIVLNGVYSKPIKNMIIDTGDSMLNKKPYDQLIATMTLEGWWEKQSFRFILYTVPSPSLLDLQINSKRKSISKISKMKK